MEHVVIRKLDHLTGSAERPALGYAVEIRERPGPAHKKGAFEDDRVWIQLQGGLFVAKARVEICWVGEYASIGDIRARTKGSPLHDIDDFWAGRPRFGYAAIASLQHEAWIEPYWGGPRTYGYEWVLMDSDKKIATWLPEREPPRGGDEIVRRFEAWRSSSE